MKRNEKKQATSKSKWLKMLVIVLLLGGTFAGCGTVARSFQRGAAGETTILLREGLDFDLALREVIFVLTRHGFDPELIQSEVGFVRTRWNYTWNDRGTHVETYRVRVISSFNPTRTQLILNVEAEIRSGRQNWVRGFDTRAVETLRNDLTMVVGN
jgi:hypothetical protein